MIREDDFELSTGLICELVKRRDERSRMEEDIRAYLVTCEDGRYAQAMEGKSVSCELTPEYYRRPPCSDGRGHCVSLSV